MQGQIDTTENITFPKPTYSDGKKRECVAYVLPGVDRNETRLNSVCHVPLFTLI